MLCVNGNSSVAVLGRHVCSLGSLGAFVAALIIALLGTLKLLLLLRVLSLDVLIQRREPVVPLLFSVKVSTKKRNITVVSRVAIKFTVKYLRLQPRGHPRVRL